VEIAVWVIVYLCSALFWLWVLKWGGAEWLEGWKAWGVIGWFAGHWSVEQIRFYALILFIFESIWFCVGVVYPEARFV